MTKWRDIKKDPPPKDGTPIKALVETIIFMEEHIPQCLMGGWKRCAERDKIVGWQPFLDPPESDG